MKGIMEKGETIDPSIYDQNRGKTVKKFSTWLLCRVFGIRKSNFKTIIGSDGFCNVVCELEFPWRKNSQTQFLHRSKKENNIFDNPLVGKILLRKVSSNSFFYLLFLVYGIYFLVM